MFDLSPEKLLILAVVALIVLGPERLPSAARSLGKAVGQLRSFSGSMREEMDGVLSEPRQVFQDAMNEMGMPAASAVGAVRNPRKALTANLLGGSSGDGAEDSAAETPLVNADPTAGNDGGVWETSAFESTSPGEAVPSEFNIGSESNRGRPGYASVPQYRATPSLPSVDLTENAPLPDDPGFN